jgi:hypothetical protein
MKVIHHKKILQPLKVSLLKGIFKVPICTNVYFPPCPNNFSKSKNEEYEKKIF